MVINERSTHKNTKYFLAKCIGHYIRLSGITYKQLFNNEKLELLDNDYSSIQARKSVNLVNYARRVINAVNEAYISLDSTSKIIVELTVKGCTNLEFKETLNCSLRTVNNYKNLAFTKFATSLESSKNKNNCVSLPSLVVYIEPFKQSSSNYT